MKKTLRKSHLPTLLKDDVLELWIEQGFVLLPVGVLLRVAGLGAADRVLEGEQQEEGGVERVELRRHQAVLEISGE